MSTSDAGFDIATLQLNEPLQADIPRSPGVYSWWLNTSRFSTPEAAGLVGLPGVPRLRHSAGDAHLLYVGRARHNLHQRIVRQHLRRTRSSTLRRTLLAVLLLRDLSWQEDSALDGRNRVVLGGDGEERLTVWMQEHLEVVSIVLPG